MKYGKVNGVDKPVSRLVLGTDYMNTKELEKICYSRWSF